MNDEMVKAEPHDNMSRAFAGMVPERCQDTPQYLSIVQWNIEWFGARKSKDKDKRRVAIVTDILEAFNADLFVFQEVAGPPKDGRYLRGLLHGSRRGAFRRSEGRRMKAQEHSDVSARGPNWVRYRAA